MKIAIIGASGKIGLSIRDEALARGRRLTAIVCYPEKIIVKNPRLNVVKADIIKDNVEGFVKGYDAAMSVLQSRLE
jgi:putative NADH-flavin reductase